ncbi:uncharacterized protein EAE98_007963 [Botrytis deweyae]|uniref:Uncharacterized protein n=1 Tax=Botrytis deweyae TaxID=2478750 RepID=A0ABQ7IFA8_9HELO|nr:uncharacterized protein EAE98_007963 [Botrytis deweyae]KAF7922437.1 hypothetical protein EAE98_007963 [Botrytis deweyae]
MSSCDQSYFYIGEYTFEGIEYPLYQDRYGYKYYKRNDQLYNAETPEVSHDEPQTQAPFVRNVAPSWSPSPKGKEPASSDNFATEQGSQSYSSGAGYNSAPAYSPTYCTTGGLSTTPTYMGAAPTFDNLPPTSQSNNPYLVTESFYNSDGKPPGYNPPAANADFASDDTSTSTKCSYLLPVPATPSYYASPDADKRPDMIPCNAPCKKTKFICSYHEGKYQYGYECISKIYQRDGRGQYIRGLDGLPAAVQVRYPDGRIGDQICRNPAVSQKFFCHECRPVWLPCYYGLARDRTWGCKNSAQPEFPWDKIVSCIQHFDIKSFIPNKNKLPPNTFGNPEDHEKSVKNPAPSGPSRSSGKSGRSRGSYNTETRSYPQRENAVNRDGVILESPRQDSHRLQQQTRQKVAERNREADENEARENERRDRDTQAEQENLRRYTEALESIGKSERKRRSRK